MTTRATRSPRRRTVVALAVVLAVLAGFIVRLVDIQVVNAEQNVAQARSFSLGAERTVFGQRGQIVDQNGQTLAGSILLYDAQVSPLNAQNHVRIGADGEKVAVPLSESAARIASITGQTAEEVEKIVTDALAENPDSQFAYLKKGIPTEEYRALADLGLPFIYFDPHPARTYPDGAVAGNLVGFMGTEGPLAGLELAQNDCLSTTNGVVRYEKGKDGVVIPGTQVETPAVDGGTLTLTIDRDLQWYLQQLIGEQVQIMGAQRGSITVVEVGTGKIRAVAEYPSVDPNDVGAAEVADRYSHVFSDSFEPGSTFKALTAAALIDGGGQKLDSTVVASGREQFSNGARVTDAFPHPEFEYTLAGVLIDSSNAGISKFSERLGAEARFDYLQRFGIGQGSAVGFTGEVHGNLVPWQNWDNQQLYNTAFGQGLNTTVPELMGAYDAIANDGTRMPLSLVESCTKADGTVVAAPAPKPVRVIDAETAASMREILENVALQSSYAPQVAVPGYRIATKTGTAEKSNGQGGYKQGVYFTSMVGFAPADAPRFVVMVTLDEPTRIASSSANAPAMQKALTQVLKNYRVLPSTTQPTLLPKFG